MLGLIEAGDLEETSFVLVENRGEDAWRIDGRQAAPVDRTVHAHQRDRVQVADDTVGLDRLIGHLLTGLSNFRRYRRKKPPFCPSLSIHQLPQYDLAPAPLSLPRSGSVRIDGAAGQESDAQQC